MPSYAQDVKNELAKIFDSEREVGRHDPDKLCAAVMKIIYSLGSRN